MAGRIWDDVIPERDRQVFDEAGYGATGGFGQRPALLVVDVTYDFCGDRREPILESIKRFRNSCGEAAWDAIPHLQTLLAAARRKRVPIIYTHAGPRFDAVRVGGWARKNARALAPTEISARIGNDIVAEIAPQPGDIVIEKDKPSAFFGTPLLSYLIAMRVDSVIVTGTTTSGCVRATVVDAFSNNLAVAVVEECCFDRVVISHKVSLFDMNGKYADVVSLNETLAYLESLPDDLFAPPQRVEAVATR
ncbi:MAG TPA: isochorismatase family protein [Chloroflexota bacterium]|nr:isochorismatase family protein [Chloroflexota bacterium]